MSLSQELEFYKQRKTYNAHSEYCITVKCSAKEIEKARQLREAAGFKILSRDIQGLYTPFACVVSCDPARIQWDVGEYRYTVDVSMGTLDDVLEIANSTIDNQQ
ncbi:hypothetical protein [Pseudanabaena biceps]|nr:hypothetical protein [Pseudanabaena biceps]